MKTLSHLKQPLHTTTPGFSHDLTEPKRVKLAAQTQPFDYAANMDLFMARYVGWGTLPTMEQLQQHRPCPLTIAFWLTLHSGPSERERKQEARAKFEAKYPPSYFESLNDAQTQEILTGGFEGSTLQEMLDDGTLDQLTLMFAGIWDVPTLCAQFLPHWSPAQQASILYLLFKLLPQAQPELAAHTAALLEQRATLESWEEALFELIIAIVSQDQEALFGFYEQDPELSFKLRSVGMEAYIHIERWEDFRRVAYELIPNYSPTALYAHLHNFGEQGLELALEKTKQVWSSTWGGVFKIHSKAVTKHALWVLQEPQRSHQDAAKRWLYREGANAIIGALELWDDEVFGAAAQDLLKDYIWLGHEALVLELAKPFPLAMPQLQAWSDEDAQEATLTEEAAALDYWLKRGLKHPIPDGVMLPLRNTQGQRLSAGQVEGLLRLLQEHHKPRARAARCALPYLLDYPQRVTLAEHLFAIWRSTEKQSAFDWCLECLPWVLPEGLEGLYLSLGEELRERIKPTPWHWGLQRHFTARWDKFLAVALKDGPPSAFIIVVNELGEQPFFPQNNWRYPHKHESHAIILDAHKLTSQEQLERFEDAILSSAVTEQRVLDDLYYQGIKLLKATWSVEAWQRCQAPLLSRGLRTKQLWAALSGKRQDKMTIFRVDQDGSQLDAEDEEISLPEHATIRAISIEELEERAQQRWSHTLAEHAIILAAPYDTTPKTKA